MAKGNSKYLQIAAYAMLTLIFIFAISIARDCSKISSLPVEGSSEGDTLDIAILYGPGSYYFYEDSIDGINKRIAEKFGKDCNQPYKLWPVNEPREAMFKLENGVFDIVASLPLDNSIKERFPVSEPVFLDRLVLVQLSDSLSNSTPINSSLDLNGRKVFVAAGSSAFNRLENLSQEIGGKIEIEESPELSDELLCLQVASGDVPLAVVNESIAKAIAENYPALKYDSSISFTQFQVWVFNPSDSVAFNRFNSWFKSYSKTESFQSLLNNF